MATIASRGLEEGASRIVEDSSVKHRIQKRLHKALLQNVVVKDENQKALELLGKDESLKKKTEDEKIEAQQLCTTLRLDLDEAKQKYDQAVGGLIELQFVHDELKVHSEKRIKALEEQVTKWMLHHSTMKSERDAFKKNLDHLNEARQKELERHRGQVETLSQDNQRLTQEATSELQRRVSIFLVRAIDELLKAESDINRFTFIPQSLKRPSLNAQTVPSHPEDSNQERLQDEEAESTASRAP